MPRGCGGVRRPCHDGAERIRAHFRPCPQLDQHGGLRPRLLRRCEHGEPSVQNRPDFRTSWSARVPGTLRRSVDHAHRPTMDSTSPRRCVVGHIFHDHGRKRGCFPDFRGDLGSAEDMGWCSWPTTGTTPPEPPWQARRRAGWGVRQGEPGRRNSGASGGSHSCAYSSSRPYSCSYSRQSCCPVRPSCRRSDAVPRGCERASLDREISLIAEGRVHTAHHSGGRVCCGRSVDRAGSPYSSLAG